MGWRPIPYRPERLSAEATRQRLDADYQTARGRRSVRIFSADPVPREVVETAIRIAGTAPSGANRQPWQFVAISDPALKAEIRRAGLATLTHTPAPMGFLRRLCGRPINEKPYVLMPLGYPADDCVVPDIHRKPLDEIAAFRE